MARVIHLDNQENLYTVEMRNKDSFLSGRKMQRNGSTQMTYSTLKPMKVVHGGLHDLDYNPNRLSFRKKSHIEASELIENNRLELCSSQEDASHSQQFDQSNVGNMRLPLNFNSRLTLTQHIQSLSQQLESPANPSQQIKYRASSRLLNMISKVLADPQEDSVTLTTHTSSLQMLIDRYEFELDEKTKEITMLKERLQRKELDMCRLQRRMMEGLAERNDRPDRICQCIRLRQSSGSSQSVMSPIVSRTTLSLDTVFENRSHIINAHSHVSQILRATTGNPADSFIKVCDGSSIQYKVPNVSTVNQAAQPQFLVELRGPNSCLYDSLQEESQQITIPMVICLPQQALSEDFLNISKQKAQECSTSTFNQCKTISQRDLNTTLMTVKHVKFQPDSYDIATQTDSLPQYISEASCQTEQEPILIIQLPQPRETFMIQSAPVTAHNSRKLIGSVMQSISERDWVDDQIHSARTVRRQEAHRLMEQVLSVSITHQTVYKKCNNRLKHFKSLVKTTTDIINSTWKLILQLRKKSKENRDAARNSSHPSLKPTKQCLETFASWFNEKYIYYMDEASCKPPEDFYTESLTRVKEYTGAVIDAAEMLYC